MKEDLHPAWSLNKLMVTDKNISALGGRQSHARRYDNRRQDNIFPAKPMEGPEDTFAGKSFGIGMVSDYYTLVLVL